MYNGQRQSENSTAVNILGRSTSNNTESKAFYTLDTCQNSIAIDGKFSVMEA
jgi:hypothetical protein